MEKFKNINFESVKIIVKELAKNTDEDFLPIEYCELDKYEQRTYDLSNVENEPFGVKIYYPVKKLRENNLVNEEFLKEIEENKYHYMEFVICVVEDKLGIKLLFSEHYIKNKDKCWMNSKWMHGFVHENSSKYIEDKYLNYFDFILIFMRLLKETRDFINLNLDN